MQQLPWKVQTPLYPLSPREASMRWGIVIRDEAYRDYGSVYVPKGKRVRDILVSFKCPRCGYVEKVEPERDH